MDLVLPRGLVAGAVADDQRGELVPAEAGGGVPGADGVGEPLRGLDEEFVARLMTDGVVDGLEAVEVDEEHGGAGVARAPSAERLAHPGGEEGAVGQVGERVVLRVVLQLGLEAHAFGDIAAVEQEAAMVAVDGGLDVEPLAAPDRKRHSMRVVGSSTGWEARKRRSWWTTLPRSSGWMIETSSVWTRSSAGQPYTPAADGLT